MKRQIDSGNTFLANVNSPATASSYDHITAEEKRKVRDEVAKAESWLKENLAKQANLKSNQDPVLTGSSIFNRGKDLYNVINPIITKQKPAPAPIPAPAPSQTSDDKANENKPEADDKYEGKGEPMDTGN